MTLYAIGDIQGCANAFGALIERIGFSASTDHLWLVGDLVNRGPDSLGVLRAVMGLGERAQTVLGNHDLHLLATVAGIRPPQRQDTLHDVLAARDLDEIVDWLRRRPLLAYDRTANRALVHAGIPPRWTIAEAEAAAHEVERMLSGPDWPEGLASMYGNAPRAWHTDLTATEQRRYAINAFTRMRYCDRDGRLDFENTGAPGTQPAALVPWFDHPLRATAQVHIVFGHWATLGLRRRADITATDTGCVWGGGLTAVPLDPPGEPITVSCRAYREP